MPEVKVVGVADPALELAEKLAAQAGATVYSDYRDFLGQVDAVWICTPTFLHAEQTIACAEAGIHVFCEKPIALDLPSADRMIATARKCGVHLMIGQVIRYYPETIKLKELVTSGELGEPIFAFGRRLMTGALQLTAAWRRDARLSGGMTLESGIHEVDTVRWLAGEVASVYARVSYADPEHPDIDTDFRALLQLRTGVSASVEVSMHVPLRDWSWGVVGTHATALSPRRGEVRLARLGEREPRLIPVELVYDPARQVNQSMLAENQAFANAVRSDRTPPIPGEEGRRNLEVVLAALRASREERVIEI
jgi:predicted dehydrogenase